jgi:hypothetical protein
MLLIVAFKATALDSGECISTSKELGTSTYTIETDDSNVLSTLEVKKAT